MFCAIATTIERCKTEGVVDVFQVVKALRVQKPGAVRTVVRIASSETSIVQHMVNVLFPHYLRSLNTTLCSRPCWCTSTPSIRTEIFKTCELLQFTQ